jgi:SEC-C motif
MKTVITFLSIFFPRLRRRVSESISDNKYIEIERNSKCYCESGKKYKHCHLAKNERKNKVALKQIEMSGNEKIVILSKIKASKLKGNSETSIGVKNTFSEIDVAQGAISNEN